MLSFSLRVDFLVCEVFRGEGGAGRGPVLVAVGQGRVLVDGACSRGAAATTLLVAMTDMEKRDGDGRSGCVCVRCMGRCLLME